uniref:Thioredoxin domain-containing protein n=1 Tax=Timema cristinae TaxID=61476 RepID=A0A7R9CFJ6_TIMCR|nr:unnamed protein product [Timema cristinae]
MKCAKSKILPEPTYTGPENVVYFRTVSGLDEELERDKRVTWLVTFYTVWNPSCTNFAPVFAKLSAEYALDNYKFGKIDVGRYPDAARKYQINDSSLSRQLPTLIQFKQGKEVDRRPTVDHNGKLICLRPPPRTPSAPLIPQPSENVAAYLLDKEGDRENKERS